jgi:hypothetical protein
MKLTRRGVQQVLHRSIYQVCAHEGFDSTTESVMSVLAGVVEEMLMKFCTLLKVNTEREVLGQSTGFVVSCIHNILMLSSYILCGVLSLLQRMQWKGPCLMWALTVSKIFTSSILIECYDTTTVSDNKATISIERA